MVIFLCALYFPIFFYILGKMTFLGGVLVAKAFISTLDGQTFKTEEDALTYLLSNYLEEVPDTSIQTVKQQLEQALPGFQFRVTKSPYTPDNAPYANENDPWFKGKEIISVTITSPIYDMPSIFFNVLPKHPSDSYQEIDEFETLEEAITFYRRFLLGAEKFSAIVLHTIQPYAPTIATCDVTKIIQSYGTADSFYEYHFMYRFLDGTTKQMGYIELDSRDFDDDTQLEAEFSAYARRLLAAYVTEVEGVVSIIYPKYQNDHTITYAVDGIPIYQLARRAKRLRVEIIEGKNEHV